MTPTRTPLAWALAMLLGTGAAQAQLNNGSTGADGPFAPQANFVMDLNSMGTYDASKWAVILNFTTVTIPAGVTVTFLNHWSGAPVVWLCTGDVVIDGIVDVSGHKGQPLLFAEGGPGGFRGGVGSQQYQFASAGLGPGGAGLSGDKGSGGGYGYGGSGGGGGAAYGGPSVFPLVGGSGGSASQTGYAANSPSGGGGGGAILIASDGNIVVNGTIAANGGASIDGPYDHEGGNGSGGAIRLLGNTVVINASSTVQAIGKTGNNNYGAQGRIRIEGNGPGSITVGVTPTGNTSYSEIAGTPFPPIEPKVWVQSIVANGNPYDLTGLDPRSVIQPASSADVQIPETAGVITLNIQASNVDVDGGGIGPPVIVRVTYSKGNAVTYTTAPLVGTVALSAVSQDVTLGAGVSAIQCRVVLP